MDVFMDIAFGLGIVFGIVFTVTVLYAERALAAWVARRRRTY